MSINGLRHGRFAQGVSIALFALLVPAVGPATPAMASGSDIPVIPTVQSWSPATGNFTLTSDSRLVVDTSTADLSTTGVTSPMLSSNALSAVANNLQSEFSTETGLTPPVVTGSSPAAGDVYLVLAANSGLGTEGYTATISSFVTISAPTSTGIFYGVQSLLQMLHASSTHTTALKGTISDSPSVGYRAMMIDVGRKFWPVADLQDEIRRMAWQKLNALHLHLNEDEAFRLYLPGTPYAHLAPVDPSSRYSQSDIAAILSVAAQNHVTVVPEIDTPAHALPLAISDQDRSLQSKCGGSYAQDLDITSATVVNWVEGLYTAVASWFPGPYFHLGSDEVEQLDACSFIAGSGKSGLQWQIDFANDLATSLASVNKRSMIWVSDSSMQPSTNIILTNFGSPSLSATMRNLGYDVIDQPATVSSGMPGIYNWSSPPLYAYTPPSAAHAFGVVVPVWADAQSSGDSTRFTLRETLLKQRMAAERAWNRNPTTQTYAAFLAKAASIGEAPGTTAPGTTPVTTDGVAAHSYDWISAYVPTTHNRLDPNMWRPALGPVRVGANMSFPDNAGSVFATAQYAKPTVLPGTSGSALQMAPEAFVTIPDGANPTSWTIAAWVYRTANQSDGWLVSNRFAALKLQQYNGTQKVGITQFGVADYTFNYVVPLNTWTHLAFVSNGQTGVTTLYADGSNVGTIAETVDFPVAAIGGPYSFTGQLGRFDIYHQALNATQVHANYVSGPGTTGQPEPASSSYEAESSANTLAGGATVISCPACSGGQEVGWLGNGGTLTFNGVNVAAAGTYDVTIAYADGTATAPPVGRSMTITVNGVATVTMTYPPTGSWVTPGGLTLDLPLQAGNNTIAFSNPSAYAPNVDKLIVPASGA